MKQGATQRFRKSRRARGRVFRDMAVAGSMFALVVPAHGQSQGITIRNTFGEVGLLDMPSAHMAPDGALSFSVGDVGKSIQRYSLSFQALPWLDTSFRYSRYAPGSYDWDRSFALKIRLLKEDDAYRPDVSVGIRDLLGTGIYSSEYVVASKHVGPFDLTAGLGWGRLAQRGAFDNPFGLVFKSFKTRSGGPSTGGVVNFGQFFHGRKVGVFGGVAWQTPLDDLTVLAEYSSDAYRLEAALKGLKARSPVNIGLSYRPLDFMSVSAGWFYGTTYGFTVSFAGDPTTSYPTALRIGPKLPPPVIRTDTQQQAALVVLQGRNKSVEKARSAGLWVETPTPNQRARQDLLQAFYSEGRGVRDVEVEGKSLVVDANVRGNVAAQCAGYARIASASGTPLATLAMADLQDPAGRVTFCPIRDAADGLGGAALARLDADKKAAKDKLERKINLDLIMQSLQPDAISVGASDAWVYYENYRYNDESEAIGRIVRVLMADVPPSVEIFHIVAVRFGVPVQQITVARSAVERAITNHTAAAGMGDAIALNTAPMDNPIMEKGLSEIYPLFTWSLDPKLTERVFDPDKPLQFMVYADLAGMVQLAPGLAVSAELTGNIWNDVNYNRAPGSKLPHVRTDVLKYLDQGKYGISSLQLTYDTRLARDLYAEVKAGYLEDMFMGGGGQVLWRPEGSRFAVGADLYQVWQRDYNRLFGARHYNILTGHVSVYYDSPWYGLNFTARVGRYLAGDYGGTIEIKRRFSTGVEIGAWATFTNVPFNKFGEGSFDKGIYIHIPLEWGLPIFSQSAYELQLHSLTRDGGQRLAGDDSLYAITRRPSYGDIVGHLNHVVEP